ncbi:ABC transporter permease [Sebaldella sp. S0638]|uniref:ABC transporter permease n=1 Tax=Sebaldella sp. S0638 TaxID=2957809 RepID=UPI0020A0F3F8|nr:ribose ABC transporter permease [Sebaldella sp. S0638]MCP1225845.1 ribose ABC transporter permease [Sebaldella sp. S0638]
MRLKAMHKINFKDYGVIIGFLLLCAIISFATPNFLTKTNILNLLRQSSIIGIIATGMTFVIISGNFDLSVGAIAALSGAITMTFLSGGHNLALAILASITVGALIGALSGILVAKINIPSLIATMGMVTITRGILLLYTGGYPVSGFSDVLSYVGNGYFLGIPIPVIVFFLGMILSYIVLSYTKFGRYVFAVGGNEGAARLSGINVDKYKILVFIINGCFAALAGIILVSRLGAATPVAGEGYELDAIASAVIGGTSVSGGEGKILMTIIGVLLISVISNGFNLLGVNIYFQYVFKGIIIVTAVGLDSYSKRKK